MPDREHARLLIDIARRDLRTAEAMETVAAFPDEVFGFHAQQASEKAFKAWLTILGSDYPRIHDLDELWSLIQDISPNVDPEFGGVTELTPFAVQFRYDVLETEMNGIDRSAIAAK